jgi:hypothetical protein
MNPVLKLWLSAFFTLAIYSLVLYKDNKVFRFAETVEVGITAANGIVLTYHNYIRPAIAVDIIENHKYSQLIPICLGLLMYLRFVRSASWVSRIPMGFWLGIGAGYIFTRNPAVFISQISASFMSLNTVDNIIFVVGTAVGYRLSLLHCPYRKTTHERHNDPGQILLAGGLRSDFWFNGHEPDLGASW